MVRPIAADAQVSLAINPYHLGFSMWEKIVESEGLEAARRIMEQDDDFAFVRNHLTRELADELGLFRFSARSDGQIKVLEPELSALHEAVLAPKYNFGAPVVSHGTCATTARSSCRTTAAPTAAGSTSSAAARCSTTCSASGGGRSC